MYGCSPCIKHFLAHYIFCILYSYLFILSNLYIKGIRVAKGNGVDPSQCVGGGTLRRGHVQEPSLHVHTTHNTCEGVWVVRVAGTSHTHLPSPINSMRGVSDLRNSGRSSGHSPLPCDPGPLSCDSGPLSCDPAPLSAISLWSTRPSATILPLSAYSDWLLRTYTSITVDTTPALSYFM